MPNHHSNHHKRHTHRKEALSSSESSEYSQQEESSESTPEDKTKKQMKLVKKQKKESSEESSSPEVEEIIKQGKTKQVKQTKVDKTKKQLKSDTPEQQPDKLIPPEPQETITKIGRPTVVGEMKMPKQDKIVGGYKQLPKDQKFDFNNKPADEPGIVWNFTSKSGWRRKKINYPIEELEQKRNTVNVWRKQQSETAERAKKNEEEVKDARSQLEQLKSQIEELKKGHDLISKIPDRVEMQIAEAKKEIMRSTSGNHFQIPTTNNFMKSFGFK